MRSGTRSALIRGEEWISEPTDPKAGFVDGPNDRHRRNRQDSLTGQQDLDRMTVFVRHPECLPDVFSSYVEDAVQDLAATTGLI